MISWIYNKATTIFYVILLHSKYMYVEEKVITANLNLTVPAFPYTLLRIFYS